jgi:hypothetical protein
MAACHKRRRLVTATTGANMLTMTRRLILATICALGLMTSTLAAAPQKPKSVIHVITVKWKPGTTEAQIGAALKAAETMNYPGVKNVWTRPIKMQLDEGYTNIIVMEFESEDALKKYADSPAQKKWYEVYMPIREESKTHDITN